MIQKRGSILTVILVAEQNKSSTSLYAPHSWIVPIPKRITSSTNNKWVIDRLGENWKPLISPFCWALVMIMLRLSIIRMNKTGDRGQPYRIPLEAGKKYEGVPLIKTTKQEFLTHPIIQLTPIRGMPIWRSTSLRKGPIDSIKSFYEIQFKN